MDKQKSTNNSDDSEKIRIEKLKRFDVLEECGREKFNEIVKMVSRFCKTEYAGIHLIDEDTQQCKVSYGIELGDMDRRNSVCQYTIESDEPFIVQDLREDPRFKDKPYVKGEPHFVFYAGVPIRTPDGHRIGSLCVMDTKTRDVSKEQIECLQLLSDEVMAQLELFLRNKQLEEMNKQAEEHAEKRDAMIKEIHHRLKNNLSYIIGILDLELMNNEDPHVQQLIRKIQKRIMSVVTIHQRLYESDNLDRLDLKSYLEVLAKDIQNSFTDESRQITCKVEGESLCLSNEHMTPFGLLMSELLINSFKHAFEGREKGEIKINLYRQNGRYRIDVEDDGIGLPEDFSLEDPDSMGSQLIVSFLDQLEAEMNWESDNGSRFSITFDARKD